MDIHTHMLERASKMETAADMVAELAKVAMVQAVEDERDLDASEKVGVLITASALVFASAVVTVAGVEGPDSASEKEIALLKGMIDTVVRDAINHLNETIRHLKGVGRAR